MALTFALPALPTMTPGGIRIRPGMLAVDALNLMCNRQSYHWCAGCRWRPSARCDTYARPTARRRSVIKDIKNESCCYPGRHLLWPGEPTITVQAEKIRLLILDVDGVLSDGLIYMGNNGEELKAFNVRDGYGIRCALTSGIDVAIITGRKAKLLEDRCTTLGITHLYQGQSDKLIAYRELLAKLDVQPDEVAYVGDDLIDWPVMAEIGLSVAVADAHWLLLPRADYVTRIAGGRGAVREVTCYCWHKVSRTKPKGNRYECKTRR